MNKKIITLNILIGVVIKSLLGMNKNAFREKIDNMWIAHWALSFQNWPRFYEMKRSFAEALHFSSDMQLNRSTLSYVYYSLLFHQRIPLSKGLPLTFHTQAFHRVLFSLKSVNFYKFQTRTIFQSLERQLLLLHQLTYRQKLKVKYVLKI